MVIISFIVIVDKEFVREYKWDKMISIVLLYIQFPFQKNLFLIRFWRLYISRRAVSRVRPIFGDPFGFFTKIGIREGKKFKNIDCWSTIIPWRVFSFSFSQSCRIFQYIQLFLLQRLPCSFDITFQVCL